MLGGKCHNCGCDDVIVIDFHHEKEEEKDYKLSDIFKCSWDGVEKECKKCILLCANCHNEHHYFSSNPKYNRSRNNKKKILEYLSIDKCEKCGYDACNSSLEFHHSAEKDFSIGDLNICIKTVENVKQLIQEIEKCKVLCVNCHRIEHFDYDKFEEKRIKIYEKVDNFTQKKRVNKDKIINLLKEQKYTMRYISDECGCALSTVKYYKDKINGE